LANNYNALIKAKEGLIKEIGNLNHQNNRTIIIPLVYKLLQNLFQNKLTNGKIGDKWTDSLNDLWLKKEKQLLIPIDERVFTYFCLSTKSLKKQLILWISNVTNSSPSNTQLFSIIEDFLLSVCFDTCPQCIRNTNRYDSRISPSRQLTLELINKNFNPTHEIRVQEGWEDKLRTYFKNNNIVNVIGQNNQLDEIAETIRILLNKPIDKDYLMVWPILESVTKRNDEVVLQLKLRDVESI